MTRQFDISKDVLLELYVNNKLSAAVIAKKLGTKSPVTILNHLKRYNIERRSKLGNRISINISKERLTVLYSNKKFTQMQIGQKFGNKSASGIQRLMKLYNIQSRNYSEANTKYPKNDFSGNYKEKAYLIGFRLGDLNICKVHQLIQARCSTTILEQVNLF